MAQLEPVDSSLKVLYKVGGTTALLAILLAPAEVVIGLLPGVQSALDRTVTVLDWFTLFQTHWFLGLRSLGLLNSIGAALLVPAMLAVYSALRGSAGAYALFGAILFFLGVAVYLADNRAFPMLSLSGQYASAATDAQRSLLAAAGQAMPAEGKSRSGLLLIEFGCLIVSVAMLKGQVFSKTTACAGMLGNTLMMIVEVHLAVEGSLRGWGMAVAAGGGLSLVAWYLLTGGKLLQLGRFSDCRIEAERGAREGATG